MNRGEALRILGLDEDATNEDIKVAYKETAQILHPDHFGNNKKLQERATEQFKNLQEAYNFLLSGKSSSPSNSAYTSNQSSRARMLEARLAGIAAARVQLVEERSAFYDQRRNGIMLLAGGILVAFFLRRIAAVAAIASACAIWGIVDLISSTGNIRSLDEHLDALNKEKRALLKELEDLEEA